MRNKHKRQSRRAPVEKSQLTVRKSVRKGKAKCVICGKHEADMFEDGLPICSRHLLVRA